MPRKQTIGQPLPSRRIRAAITENRRAKSRITRDYGKSGRTRFREYNTSIPNSACELPGRKLIKVEEIPAYVPA
jgi:hypothetical protein